MRIAIASSGLGHVARGIETWAADSAAALSRVQGSTFAKATADKSGFRVEEESGGNQAEGNPARGVVAAVPSGMNRPVECTTPIQVTLFAGAPLSGVVSNLQSPILHQPFPPKADPPLAETINHSPFTLRILPCLRRSGRLARWLARWSPGFTWRWGLKNPYGWEQFSFWLRLWPHLVRGRFDILHVQDPMVADWCRRFRRLGWVKTREILAHGTEEPLEFLERFEYVQHLAPWHLRECERQLWERGRGTEERKGREGESAAEGGCAGGRGS
jgi:hypothetical protein